MDKLTSILAIMDPSDEARHVITKAMVLARHFRARIELFLCDSEQDYALRQNYDAVAALQGRAACLAEGQRFLEALRRSMTEDVSISTHVACHSPLYEAIVHRAMALQPDLVIKSAAGRHPLRRLVLDANDWQLARTCPAPLLLTRGRPWAAVPRFAAALDMAEEDAALPRCIVQSVSYLAQGCQATVDVLYSHPQPESIGTRVDQLKRLVHEFGAGGEHIEIVRGEPERTLPALASRANYDLLAVGALTRKSAWTSLVGTLTSQLIDTLDCDFLLVKSSVPAREDVWRMASEAASRLEV